MRLQFSCWDFTRIPGPITKPWFLSDSGILFSFQHGPHSSISMCLGSAQALFSYKWVSRCPGSPTASPPTDLVGHQVTEQHHVPPVDAHAVVDHRVLDFIDDGCPGSLNAQGFLHLGTARDERGRPLLDAAEYSVYFFLCPENSKQTLLCFPKMDCWAILSGRPRANFKGLRKRAGRWLRACRQHRETA